MVFCWFHVVRCFLLSLRWYAVDMSLLCIGNIHSTIHGFSVKLISVKLSGFADDGVQGVGHGGARGVGQLAQGRVCAFPDADRSERVAHGPGFDYRDAFRAGFAPDL